MAQRQWRGRHNKNRNYNKQDQRRFNGINYLGIIYENTTIEVNKHYQSANKRYFFTFQPACNFVIYRSADNRNIWSSGTTGKGVNKMRISKRR